MVNIEHAWYVVVHAFQWTIWIIMIITRFVLFSLVAFDCSAMYWVVGKLHYYVLINKSAFVLDCSVLTWWPGGLCVYVWWQRPKLRPSLTDSWISKLFVTNAETGYFFPPKIFSFLNLLRPDSPSFVWNSFFLSFFSGVFFLIRLLIRPASVIRHAVVTWSQSSRRAEASRLVCVFVYSMCWCIDMHVWASWSFFVHVTVLEEVLRSFT